MSYRTEALVAVLVSGEALLRDAGWPACRGQPTVVVRIGVLAQFAGAVASVVDGAPEAPCGEAEGQGDGARAWVIDPMPWAKDPPAYWCRDPECWTLVGVPDIYCARHPRAAPVGVWQRARLRAGVFAVEQGDG